MKSPAEYEEKLEIKKVNKTISSLTIGGNGYYDAGSVTIPSGYTYLFATITNFSTSTTALYPLLYNGHLWFLGNANGTATNIAVSIICLKSTQINVS